MDNLKTKLGLIAGILLLFTASGTAAITDVQVNNIFPDSELIDRNMEVGTRIEADATTTTTVELWIEKPNGSIVQVNSGQEVTVKSGSPKEITYTVQSDEVEQYGIYEFRANQTNNNINSSITIELVPRPNIRLSNPTTVEINGLKRTYFNLDINSMTGEAIQSDNLVTGNLSINKIVDNESTDNIIEKEKVIETPLTLDNSTQDLEAYIDTTDLVSGSYELRVDANITSCEGCRTYPTSTSDVLNIDQDYAYSIYSQKWGSYSAENILTNQGNLDENLADTENKVDGLSNSVANLSIDDPDTLVWIWRGSVILLLFIIMSVIVYYSGNESRY